MKLLILLLFISALIPRILIILSIFTSIRTPKNREKSSPYECGFDPNHSARTPFSLRFFLLAVIFLIFDIEIALLLPLPLTIINATTHITLLPATIFILLLLLGILHE